MPPTLVAGRRELISVSLGLGLAGSVQRVAQAGDLCVSAPAGFVAGPRPGLREVIAQFLLVTKIRVGSTSIRTTGETAALNEAASEIKMGTSFKKVPSFISEWRARSDSNARHSGS